VSIFWVLVGIFVSIFLPVAVRTLLNLRKRLGVTAAAKPGFGQRFKLAIVKYMGWGWQALGYLAAAVFVAAVIVSLFGLKFYTERDAILAGFAWESFVNKLYHATGNSNVNGDLTSAPKPGLNSPSSPT
jgi:hypothetical protein